jgi:hypothetical protein
MIVLIYFLFFNYKKNHLDSLVLILTLYKKKQMYDSIIYLNSI